MAMLFYFIGQNDPDLAQFSNLLKCLKTQQGSGGMNNVGDMDWKQWQTVARSNDGSMRNLNDVWRKQTPPPWTRPGEQRPGVGGPGYNNQNMGGQPRPGVHPDDWNNNQPGTAFGYPRGNNMNWPSNQDMGRNRDTDRERTKNERRKFRNKNRRKGSNDRQREDEVM